MGEDFSAGCAFVDGEYVPIGEARVPILDMGFVRSDLTYDVVAVWEGAFFRLDDHLDRLLRGCERLRLRPPLNRDEIRASLIGCVRRSGLRRAYVEAIVTRGVPLAGVRDPREVEARFYAYAIPYSWIQSPQQQERGASLVVARDVERIRPRSVDPTVKNFHWGDLVRGLFEAYDRDADLAVLTDGAGLVTEGGGFNVFALVDGVVYTPSDGVLLGITRGTVVEIAEELGVEVRCGAVPVELLQRADEVWLTSTAGGVMPVTRLDDVPVGSGVPGELTGKIRDRYWELHSDPRYTLPVDY